MTCSGFVFLLSEMLQQFCSDPDLCEYMIKGLAKKMEHSQGDLRGNKSGYKHWRHCQPEKYINTRTCSWWVILASAYASNESDKRRLRGPVPFVHVRGATQIPQAHTAETHDSQALWSSDWPWRRSLFCCVLNSNALFTENNMLCNN